MTTLSSADKIDMKALLSTLWIFVLLNAIIRDIHEFFRPGWIEEIISGTVNGTEITEGVMLLGGIFEGMAILMVILARILPIRINRPANIVMGILTILFIVANGMNDLDDYFFAAVEITALAVIIWLAWNLSGEGDLTGGQRDAQPAP